MRWIASSIVTLQQPKPQTAPAEEDDNNDFHAWAQAHGVNVIPDNNDDANTVAPIANLDEDADIDANKEDDDEEDQAVVCPCMPPTRLFKPCSSLQCFTTWSTPITFRMQIATTIQLPQAINWKGKEQMLPTLSKKPIQMQV